MARRRPCAQVTLLGFGDLRGWAADDHAAALAAFRETCDLMRGRDWRALCALAAAAEGPGGRAELLRGAVPARC